MEHVNERAGWGRADYDIFHRCARAGIEVELCVLPPVDGSVPHRRQRDSEAVRALARSLLARHGIGDAVIARHAQGFPLWPSGWVGSLSHSAGWGAVALGRRPGWRGVGIDIEDPARMKPALWSHILTAGERRRLERLEGAEAALGATLAFSAKEAAFKALSPLGLAVPGFFDLVVVRREEGGFGLSAAAAEKLPAVEALSGWWAVVHGLVLAVCGLRCP